jgi:hypothetical protein
MIQVATGGFLNLLDRYIERDTAQRHALLRYPEHTKSGCQR